MSFTKRAARILAYAIVCGILSGLVALFIAEWAAGCGETYTDSQGVVHKYECIFLPNK